LRRSLPLLLATATDPQALPAAASRGLGSAMGLIVMVVFLLGSTA
jgi:hypothetical protein